MLVLWIGAMGVKISLLLLGARQGVSSLLPRIRPGIVLLLTSATVLIGAAFALPTLHDVLGVFLGENIVWPILPLQAAPVVFAAVALLLQGATPKDLAADLVRQLGLTAPEPERRSGGLRDRAQQRAAARQRAATRRKAGQ